MYSKALYRLINTQLNVAESKAYEVAAIRQGGRKTGEQSSKHGRDQELYSHKFQVRQSCNTRLYSGGHQSNYKPVRLGLTTELRGERQRANRIRHPCSYLNCMFTTSGARQSHWKMMRATTEKSSIDPTWRQNGYLGGGTTSKFRRSTQRIIDGNSIVYEHKSFYFLCYIYKL